MAKLAGQLADPAIPTLAAVLDPAELSRQLSNALPRWDCDSSRKILLRVLKWHKASRCTLEIMLPTASGWQELIGKVYSADRSDVYRIMHEMRQAGFGGEEDFSIPRPVAYLPSLRLLLYEKVTGTRARSLIADANAPDRVVAVKRCAQWLARFHARAPRLGPALHLENSLRTWGEWLQDLADPDSSFAGKARRLLANLQAVIPTGNGIAVCAGHGMYTCGQVVLLDGRTVTIDWDTFNLADPSHDVARFCVDLKRMAMKYFGSMRALDWAAELFLQSYADAGGPPLPTLTFHQAAICLERARSDVKKQVPGRSEQAEMMLDEGLRILDDRRHGE